MDYTYITSLEDGGLVDYTYITSLTNKLISSS